MSAENIDELRLLARRIAEAEGLELVDVEFKPGKSRGLLRVYLDKKGGVTLGDCENVSRQLSAVLDVKDAIKNAYLLEVSSPGLDRPFQTDRDYERSLGQTVKVTFEQNGRSEQIIGRLMEAGDTEIVVDHDGEEHRIPRESIRRAHQEIPMPAGRPAKKRGKRR